MKKGTVLLIDDDPDMLIIGQRIIERAGYRFVSARSGKEGLEEIKSQRPDLILLDYMIPDLNGEQFLKKLFFEEECKDIPVAVLTARANKDEHMDQLFKLGLKAYLFKPFGHRELVNVIDNLIRISRIQGGQIKPSQDRGLETLSEEIRISIESIIGLTKLLLDGVDGQINDQQRMDLTAIYNSSRNLLKLIEDKSAGSPSNRKANNS